MATLFERLDGLSPSDLKKRSVEGLEWFRNRVRDVRSNTGTFLESGTATDTLTGDQLMGGMYMFVYDAKYQDTLPYWDRFPLVIVTDLTKNGFQGLNLHYLSPRDRVKLLDGLYAMTVKETVEKDLRFDFSYNDIKSISKLKLAKPCLKKYLFSHTVGNIMRVDPKYWDLVAMLPSQQFTINANTVYAESRRKI
jgi:hypothetical protein|tara:strand:- start:7290 stop:7871 length:582 start_codon:yes stop_codon:yes gene_type:complete